MGFSSMIYSSQKGAEEGGRAVKRGVESVMPDAPPPPPIPEVPKADEQAARDREAAGQARERQRRSAAAAYGRNDTILTGPLGLTDEPASKRRTILGA